MTDTRRIIRVFLASPGDLQDERLAVRDAVTDFNEEWADRLGYQVELMGWEDTIARFGRPQQLINQELDRCDLFLGMMWKRWGTPPDGDGEYTSGFHEEFARAVARREQSRKPEISLFFKIIPDGFRDDPGEDLRKVLEFRELVISKRKILFQTFENARQIEKLARRCVTSYAQRAEAEDTASQVAEGTAEHTSADTTSESSNTTTPDASPLSAEGFDFLESLVKRIGQDDAMNAVTANDIARFRLLANTTTSAGNDGLALGAHDANLLYAAHVGGVALGRKETETLARLGFQHLSNENVPLWCWFSSQPHKDGLVQWSSFVPSTSDTEKIGALRVMRALEIGLPADDTIRRHIIGSWFSEGVSAIVKNAALRYLAKCGRADDLGVVKAEYDLSDNSTSRSALESMVDIQLRTGSTNAAQELVLLSQFHSMDAVTLQRALVQFDSLETDQLQQLGLEHHHAVVRLRSIRTLVARNSLSNDVAERLTRDSDPIVRNEALAVLIGRGRLFSDDEVENILTPPQTVVRPYLENPFGRNGQDQGLLEKYRRKVLAQLSEKKLVSLVDAGWVSNNAYFVLSENYFKNHAFRLRRDIDDTFKSYFEAHVSRIVALGDSELVTSVRDLEDFTRVTLTRNGLDVLCRKGRREDLERIRAHLRSGYASLSALDALYLARRGQGRDIALLAKAVGDASLSTEEIRSAVALAMTRLGRHSIPEVVSAELPAILLSKTIELWPKSTFSGISDDALFALLDDQSDEVRKAAALKAVQSFTSKRVRATLQEYVTKAEHRYYNVIHWLDLGASMSRRDAQRVARAAPS